jgi:hypothetical protein
LKCRSQLKDKAKSKEQSTEKLGNIRIGRKPVWREDLENALVSYCLIMEEQFSGLTTNDVKRMVFPTHFLGKKKVEWKWFHSFVCQHSQPSLGKPQLTPAARAKGSMPENVLKFFDMYEPLLEKIVISTSSM